MTESLEFPTTAGRLAAWLNGEVIGDDQTPINRFSSIEAPMARSLCFLADRKYLNHLKSVTDSVVLTSKEFSSEAASTTLVVVDEPKVAFHRVLSALKSKPKWQGISPLASIHPSAQIAPGASIGPYAVVGAKTVVGAGTTLFPFAYLGEEVSVGEQCRIHPQVVVLDRVAIGNRVVIFPGAIIGSEGFGIVDTAEGMSQMPQIGTVVIEDGVRIGAHCTIDRGALGETRIGKNAQLDDQVHVGHNCQIGANTILCAQVGLSGSVKLGQKVILAGQVGIADGIEIGDKARVGAQSGVGINIPAGETYFSSPAFPIKEAMRSIRYFRKLPELWERLKRLEKGNA